MKHAPAGHQRVTVKKSESRRKFEEEVLPFDATMTMAASLVDRSVPLLLPVIAVALLSFIPEALTWTPLW